MLFTALRWPDGKTIDAAVAAADRANRDDDAARDAAPAPRPRAGRATDGRSGERSRHSHAVT